MEKKQNVPALRFQGFSGEWKRKTLGDFGNVAMNRRIFKEQTSETGEIPFYKIGTFGKEPDAYISRQLFEEYKAKYPYPDVGDILLSAAGSIGKTVEYTGKDEYFQDSNIVWLKHDERLDNPFLKYFYSKVKWGTLEGGTVKRLYNKILLETEIVLPEIIEQKKIGKFFASYDRMIAHQEGKIRKLQQFRQAMLTKLFPREGAAESELRFRGFSGKWKSQKMKDLGSFLKGKLYSKKNIQTSGVPLILYGRLYTQYELVIDEVDTFAVPYENSVWSIGGEVIVPASGETAEDIAIASVVKRKGILLGGDLNIIRPNDTVSSVFLALSISYGHIHNELAKRAQGKSIVHIHNSDLVQLDIRLPSIEEQKAIGNFFYQLDRYISLQQKKLKRMQRLKAALLEKLFV